MPEYRCPACSNPITADDKFCPSCGQRLTMAPAPVSQPAALGPAVPGGSTSGRGSGPSPILVVVGLVVIGALAAFGVVQAGILGPKPTVPPPGASLPLPTSAAALSDECVREVGPFISALEDLDSRLTVGLSFSDYSTRVGDVRVAYDRIDIPKLDAVCITLVGAPGEDAYNDYVAAYNTWNDCINNVDCSNDTITPQLQAQWAKATTTIAEIRAAMR